MRRPVPPFHGAGVMLRFGVVVGPRPGYRAATRSRMARFVSGDAARRTARQPARGTVRAHCSRLEGCRAVRP